MLASQLIMRLTELIQPHGEDLKVKIDTNPLMLVGIDYVEIDCDEDLIVISAQSVDEAAALDEEDG